MSNHLTLLAQSLPSESNEQSSAAAMSRGNRNRCPIRGTLYNTNTIESFHKLDKKSLLRVEAKKVPLVMGLILELCAVVCISMSRMSFFGCLAISDCIVE